MVLESICPGGIKLLERFVAENPATASYNSVLKQNPYSLRSDGACIAHPLNMGILRPNLKSHTKFGSRRSNPFKPAGQK